MAFYRYLRTPTRRFMSGENHEICFLLRNFIRTSYYPPHAGITVLQTDYPHCNILRNIQASTLRHHRPFPACFLSLHKRERTETGLTTHNPAFFKHQTATGPTPSVVTLMVTRSKAVISVMNLIPY